MSSILMRPAGSTAVMARRIEPPDALDYFPTPPWATRALMEFLGPVAHPDMLVWEPACGSGHMADVLKEFPWRVFASDVYDYGYGQTGSFVGAGPDVMPAPSGVDWVITNPPFRLAQAFVQRGLSVAREGVAMLVRTAWLEGGERYRDLFAPHPPAVVLQFVDRVAMVKGRWRPGASTATSYCWIIWRPRQAPVHTRLAWVPPGARVRLTRHNDVARYADRGVAVERLL